VDVDASAVVDEYGGADASLRVSYDRVSAERETKRI
jgi:hypothetical protein